MEHVCTNSMSGFNLRPFPAPFIQWNRFNPVCPSLESPIFFSLMNSLFSTFMSLCTVLVPMCQRSLKHVVTSCKFPTWAKIEAPSHMSLSRGTLATWLTPLRRDGGILWLCTRIEFLKQWLLLRSSTPSRTAMQGWQRWKTTLLFVFVSYLYLCQELSELFKILSYVAFMGISERDCSLMSTSYISCFFNSCLWFLCSLWKLSHDRLPRFSHWIER